MSVKIEFSVISTTGEDDRFRANELNYHGPTIGGWRSSINCSFPQEIVIQLKIFAVLHQIQILAHQYLIPQKIEIYTSEKLDCDNSPEYFEYLGFVTFSDNKATHFRSRELKSVIVPPAAAKYVKLRIHSNHENAKNVFNQVGLVAVNVLGEAVGGEEAKEGARGLPRLEFSLPADIVSREGISPYDDLAFEMRVDRETVKIMKLMELKKLEAARENRFVYAKAIDVTLENLKAAGEILGRYEQEKMRALHLEDYDEAKSKKLLIDRYRKKVYAALNVERLLQAKDILELGDSSTCENDSPSKNNSKVFSENLTDHKRCSLLKSENSIFFREASVKTCGYFLKNQQPSRFNSRSSSSPKMLSPAFLNTSDGIHPSKSNTTLHQNCQEIISKEWEVSAKEKFDENVRPANSLSHSSSFSEADEWSRGSNGVESSSDSVSDFCSSKNQFVDDKKKEKLNNSFSWTDFSSSKKSVKSKDVNLEMKSSFSEHQSLGKRGMTDTNPTRNSFDAYEERMLPALKSYHGNEIVRGYQMGFSQLPKTSLNEKEKKQASLPISVFGIEMIEKFYSKNFSDKEESLIKLQQELKQTPSTNDKSRHCSFNKIARAATFLLHRALRDKVFSVYRCAAETVRLFFTDFIPRGVTPSEIVRSVEKLLPELLAKSGDVTPRIHNMAAHTVLSIAECEEVRRLNIIPTHLSRPLTSSVHPRLALSRLEMVEQLILNFGISTEKKSGLTCRTLAEFGSSGLHHPAEAVRKVSERILVRVYEENPRIVRKQLPPDDSVTRRNLLYRQLFQEFDVLDAQKKLNGNLLSTSLPGDNRKIFSSSEKVDLTYSSCAIDKNVRCIKIDKEIKTQNDSKPCLNFSMKKINEKTERFVKQESNKNQMSTLSRPRPPKTLSQNNKGLNVKQSDLELPELLKSSTSKLLGNKEKENSKNGCLTDKYSSLPNSSFDSSHAPKFLREPAKSKNKNLLTRKRLIKGSRESLNCFSGIPLPVSGLKNKVTCCPSENVKEKTSNAQLLLSQVKKGKINHVVQITSLDGSQKKRNCHSRSWNDFVGSQKSSKSQMSLSLSKNPKTSLMKTPGCSSDNQLKDQRKREKKEEIARLSLSMMSSIKNHTDSYPGETLGSFKRTCIFCLTSKEFLTEESLNEHYLKDCLMLTACQYCKEVIEISEFTNHMLDECKLRCLFKKCTTCQEAITTECYNRHNCPGPNEDQKKLKSKCPFCHMRLENGENCWRKHLVENRCLNNPRISK